MFENLSRNVRFRKWLEHVISGGSRSYPDSGSFPDDAAAFLERWDQVRKEHRVLEQRYRDLLAGLATIADGNATDGENELLDRLNRRLEDAAGREQHLENNADPDVDPDTSPDTEDTRAELEQARAALEQERRKLDPVLRYAYNLRRLLQSIHAIGRLTPETRTHTERLLAAGGVTTNTATRKAS